MPTSLAVYSQVCHSHVQLALKCVGSFVKYCRDEFTLNFIEDGSLTEEDVAQLSSAFAGARIYRRREQNEIVAPYLKNLPACREYRDTLPYAIKLLDMPAIAAQNNADFAYIDSDVYFYRPFIKFDRREMPEDLVMMNESRDSYAMSFKDRFFGPSRVKLPRGANSGLIFGRRGVFDWEFVEWFVGRPENRKTYAMLEQTTWASLAHRARSFMFDAGQINIPHDASHVTDELVAHHYVMDSKKLLKNEVYLQTLRTFSDASSASGAPVALKTVPMQFPSWAGALAYKSALRLEEATKNTRSDHASIMIEGFNKRIAALRQFSPGKTG
jgi:hypothetical protein